ncbi:MAG: pitrilysin family protein [Syntrophorhabdales bacterium]
MEKATHPMWRIPWDGSRTGEDATERRQGAFVAMALALFLAILLLLSPVLRSEAKEAGPGRELIRATLRNGLKVVIVRNTLAPVVTTIVNYLVGSVEAPHGFPGMAHAQEHMMFRGSPGLSADQLAAIIAAMGGKFNADTQQTITQYFLTIPSADLDTALRVEATRMRGVLDSEQLWAKERGAIEQEVTQDYSNPEFVSYTKVLAAMFKSTPYEESPLGSIASFDKTTGGALKKFFETWYAPNNAVLVIVGDVDPARALAATRRYFDRIPPKRIPARPEVHLRPVKPETLRLKTDDPYGLATIAFRFPGFQDPDYPACRVLADALSNQRSRLSELVPEGKALYTVFSLDTLPQAGIGYAMAAFPKGADPEILIEEMRRIVASYLKDGFPADLVEAAKRTRRTKTELEKNSVVGLAAAWSNALVLEGRESPEDAVRAVGRVSVEDVDRAARKYLDVKHSIVTILTPEASGKAVAGKGHGMAVESFAPTNVKPVKLPPWVEKSLSRLEIPTPTVNPVVTILPNGLKLIVQPETASNTITIYGHVRNNPDMEAPEGKKGVDRVLDELFPYGTATLDRVAFQKALDDIGAEESAGTDFSLEVLAEHFERGVQLLADNELSPVLPEEAFKTVRQQVAATVAGELESPDYLARRALRSALFPQGDPALREATPDAVSAFSLADVLDYYHAVFRPDLTTMVVIGKVTPETAKAVIERYFGSWKAVGPPPETFLPPVPPNKPSASDVPDLSRIQAKVTLAQTLGLTRSDADYYALQLGNHVLGGAFYATRLYRDLREETGLVYYVTSTFDLGVTRSLYGASFGCNPENTQKARRIVARDLVQMQTTPVTSEELQRAKALLLREIPLSESSVEGIGQKLVYLSEHFLPLDEPILAARTYVDLTAEQVRKAYEKWLRPGDLVEVVEGPPPK